MLMFDGFTHCRNRRRNEFWTFKTQNKWLPASPEEGPEGGYDIWGSLLRQGLLPFFTRLFSSEEYEQGKDSMKIVKETRMQHLSKSNLTGMSFSPLS
jgi:hypothetical protein